MTERHVDRITRQAARGISRRTSLASLGAAAIGAAVAAPASTVARKHRKKRRKKRKDRCKKKVRKQCQREIDECRDAILEVCTEFPGQECLDLLLPCCATCQVRDTFLCLVELSRTP